MVRLKSSYQVFTERDQERAWSLEVLCLTCVIKADNLKLLVVAITSGRKGVVSLFYFFCHEIKTSASESSSFQKPAQDLPRSENPLPQILAHPIMEQRSGFPSSLCSLGQGFCPLLTQLSDFSLKEHLQVERFIPVKYLTVISHSSSPGLCWLLQEGS